MRHPRKPFLASVLPLLVLVGALVVFFWKFFLRGQVPLQSDWLAHRFHPWKSWPGSQVEEPYNPELDDPVLEMYLERSEAAKMIRAGRLPLWNPHILCGTPFLAANKANPFAPSAWAYLVFSAPQARVFGYLLEFLIAGLGMWAYLRRFGVGSAAAVFAAVSFMFCGTFTTWLQLDWMLGTFCWLPFALLALDHLVSGTRAPVAWALLGIAAIAFQWLGGLLQLSLYLVGAVSVYALIKLWLRHRRVREWRPLVPASLLAAFVVVGGGCLAALQWAPELELAGHAYRSQALYARKNFMPLSGLLALVYPDFFGNPVDRTYVGGLVYRRSYLQTHGGGYVGILTLALALLALSAGRRRREEASAGGECGAPQARALHEKRILAVMSLGSLLFLLSLSTPLGKCVEGFVPHFHALDHFRVLIFCEFGLCALAGFGLHQFVGEEGLGQAWRRWLFIVGTVLALTVLLQAAALLLASSGSAPEPGFWRHLCSSHQRRGCLFLFRPIAHSLLLLAGFTALMAWGRRRPSRRSVVLALAVGLGASDILLYACKYNPFVSPSQIYPSTPSVDFLRAQQDEAHGPFRISGVDNDDADYTKGDFLPPNSAWAYGLYDIRGKESLFAQRYLDYTVAIRQVQRLFPTTVHLDKFDSPLLDLLNVRYFLTTRDLSKHNASKFVLAFDKEIRVYENRQALPRAFTIDKARAMTDENAIVGYLKSASFDPRREVIIETEGPALSSPSDAHFGVATVKHYGPQEVIVSAATDQRTYLVLADSYYPGWRAYVDSTRRPILPANYALRAVELEKGDHEVVFAYQPQSFRIGATLCLFTLLLMSLWAVRATLSRGPWR